MSQAHDFVRSVDISKRKPRGPRVLIVRLSAVGDCVQTMPVAAAVRDHWPDAHVTWVVERGAAPLVEAHDAVDQMIVLPKRFLASPRILARLRTELRRHQFDIAIDPQGLTKSGVVAWLSGAKRRIGFARPLAREFNPWLQTEWVVPRTRHRVDQYLELLRPLGIDRPKTRFGLRIPPAATDKISAFLRQSQIEGRVAVLNPGAGWDSKRWPVERFAEVARHLSTRGLQSVVAWGGNRERAWAETIVAQSAGTAIMAPATTLLELTALLQAARLFIGSDTGPLHMAAAVGTPCVALFGASSAVACGPYGPGHVALQRSFDESTSRKRPGGDNWAMRQISVNDACRACDTVLAGRQLAAA